MRADDLQDMPLVDGSLVVSPKYVDFPDESCAPFVDLIVLVPACLVFRCRLETKIEQMHGLVDAEPMTADGQLTSFIASTCLLTVSVSTINESPNASRSFSLLHTRFTSKIICSIVTDICMYNGIQTTTMTVWRK